MNVTYILRCADNSYYTGWTNDIARRMVSHNHGITGAKYTRSRRPVTLAYCEGFPSRSDAMKREAALKALSHEAKDKLITDLSAQAEKLCVYDYHMNMVGMLPRTVVHACGLRHKVIHVLVKETRQGKPGVWLQQRAWDRPVLPGFFDWTATGHIAAHEDADLSAVRELREEAGLRLDRHDLILAGEYHHHILREEQFEDDEMAITYIYHAAEPPSFHPGNEVDRMVWAADEALTRAFVYGEAFPAVQPDGTEDLIAANRLSPMPAQWRKLRKL